MSSVLASCSRPDSVSTTRAWGTSTPTARRASRLHPGRSESSRLAGSLEALDVRVDHDFREVLELGLRLPSEDALRLPRVPAEVVDLRGAEVLLVDLHVRLPIRDAGDAERLFHELANGMGLARRSDEVIRLPVLEDPPHQVDELRRVPPVPPRIQVPECDRFREAVMDFRHAIAHLACQEFETASLGFVIEQDAVGNGQAVGLPVVHTGPVRVDFGDAVRTPGMKRCALVLRLSVDLPEQDRKSTRLNSSHLVISYAVFCLKKKKKSSHTSARLTSGAYVRRPRPTDTT